jgi:50S ribosomal subunit-associated GTPase HflX
LVVIINKLDLLTDQEITSIQELETLNIKLIFLSAKQNIGVDELKKTSCCLLLILSIKEMEKRFHLTLDIMTPC